MENSGFLLHMCNSLFCLSTASETRPKVIRKVDVAYGHVRSIAVSEKSGAIQLLGQIS